MLSAISFAIVTIKENKINKTSDPDQLYAMRHSLAHVMAAAVMRLWPEARLGVGPVIDHGFCYDVDIEGTMISEEDLPAIEAEMRKIIKANEEFVYSEQKIDDAIKWAEKNKQIYKKELLHDLKQSGTTVLKELKLAEIGIDEKSTKKDSAIDNVSFYTNGDFTDLCRGPHVESTGKVGAFKLTGLAGAYWRGDEKKPQMQRIHGVAFTTQAELDEYLEKLEQAKSRDHRKLGRELDLYVISETVGAGLPMFTPRGTILRELLSRYSQQLRAEHGFQQVWTPHITKEDLYKQSGHWDKFGDELFLVSSQESSDKFVLKPMNCPHHVQIYKSQPRSYRDLPIKYMETTTDYRDEKSGELHGLARVRSLTQDDSHAFCRPDQVDQAVEELIKAVKELYNTLEMELIIELSFRDKTDAYLGDEKLWEMVQTKIHKMATKNKLKFRVAEGEATFYGPKIDFRAIDAVGRDWQVATIQLDFVQPERFELEYTDEKGEAARPVMIHCALLGTIERFLSVYIEHTAGRFPFWLAPEQIRILQINDQVDDYAKQVAAVLDGVALMKPIKYNELRHTLDNRNASLGKKIAEAEIMKVPVMLIIGTKDAAAKEVSVRTPDGESKVKLAKLKGWVESQKG